jgi:hypothetical protein
MTDLTHLPNELDEKKAVCKAIIETPKGCRNKFDYDPDANLFMPGVSIRFGLIPSTLGKTGCQHHRRRQQDALDQVEAFFVSYNQQRGKKFNVIGTGGPKKALKFLKAGRSGLDRKFGSGQAQMAICRPASRRPESLHDDETMGVGQCQILVAEPGEHCAALRQLFLVEWPHV